MSPSPKMVESNECSHTVCRAPERSPNAPLASSFSPAVLTLTSRFLRTCLIGDGARSAARASFCSPACTRRRLTCSTACRLRNRTSGMRENWEPCLLSNAITVLKSWLRILQRVRVCALRWASCRQGSLVHRRARCNHKTQVLSLSLSLACVPTYKLRAGRGTIQPLSGTSVDEVECLELHIGLITR